MYLYFNKVSSTTCFQTVETTQITTGASYHSHSKQIPNKMGFNFESYFTQYQDIDFFLFSTLDLQRTGNHIQINFHDR